MQHSTNLNMNLPERADQYNLDHWNENTNILDSEIQNIKDLNDNTLKTSLLNFCYPVGSLYWSSNSTDPSTLFGGTWKPIKDCFVWAKGDSDTVNATGGSKTVTLTTEQIPSHKHTFAGSTVTSGINNRGHTHSVTPSGSISGGAYKFTGDRTSTSLMSENSTGTFVANTAWDMWKDSNTGTYVGVNAFTTGNLSREFIEHRRTSGSSDTFADSKYTINVEHYHYLVASGTISVTTNPTFKGSSTTSSDESLSHTHSVTSSGTIGNTGDGQSHNNMPPYIVKYCWERTA